MAQHTLSVAGSESVRASETPRRWAWVLMLLALVGCEDCNPLDGEDAGPPVPGWVLVQPFPEIQTLLDVHVLSEVRAYAVGTGGAVLRYDEGQWTQEDVGTNAELRSVSAVPVGEDDEFVMAVGASGTILVRNAGTWSQLDAPANILLFGVWVAAEDDAFIVGDQGAIYRYDGTGVVSMANESVQLVQLTYPGIQAASVDAGTPARFPDGGIDLPPDAVECVPGGPIGPLMYCARSALTTPLKGVAGVNPDNVYAIGPQGSVYDWNGTEWLFDETDTTRSLVGVYAGEGVWIVGADGLVAQRDGFNAWDLREFKMELPIFLQSIYNAGGNRLFVVGLAGSVYEWVGDGYQETEIEPNIEWRGVHGVGGLVFVVGAGGRILRGPAEIPNEFEEGDAGVLIEDGRILPP